VMQRMNSSHVRAVASSREMLDNRNAGGVV
jgi:hypothetical protein